MIKTLLLVMASLVIGGARLAECRGPHHPRGEAVVKHSHYRPTKNSPNANTKLTEDAQLLHDKEHIQEHLEEIIHEPDVSKMTDEEMEFYYFQMHDTDKNSKLDGLEMLQAILHTIHTHDEAKESELREKVQDTEEDFEYYIELIDHLLKEDDLDDDGYLNYVEFASGRKKAVLAEKEASKPSVKMVI